MVFPNQSHRQQFLERGLDNFVRFGCYGCHKVDAAVYPFMQGQRPKVGPPLDAVATKTTEAFLYKWIRNPKDFRPDTRMPRFWGLSNNSHDFRYRFADRGYDDVSGEAWANAEIHAIGRYILSVSKGAPEDEAVQLGDPARGERIVVGDYEASQTLAKACIACHDVPIRTPELRVDAARMREWVDPKTRRKYGWGDRMSRQHGPSLAGIGSKVRAKWLVEWLENPRGYWHDTNMPDLRLTREEARDVAAYLMTLRHEEFEKLPPVAADQGVLERIAQELKVAEQSFPTASQALAAVRAMSPEERTLYVGKKLVAHYGCFGCHQMEAFKNATPIGTELTKWGSKVVERLEFNHVPIDHTRFDFAYTKLVNPRIYDLGMPRADLPFERLKMPRFGFTFTPRRNSTKTVVRGHAGLFYASTPMLLFIGQVSRADRGRGAFQEVDYEAFFAPLAKWAVEIGDAARVGDQRVGKHGGQALGEGVPGLAQGAPFLAMPLEPVHVERHGHAGGARNGGEQGIGGVAAQHGVAAVRQQVQRGEKGVRHRVEVLMADGGQVVEPHAQVLARGVALAAVDGDVVATRGQTPGSLLGEGLEAAIAGRNAPGSDDGDSHARTAWRVRARPAYSAKRRGPAPPAWARGG